MSLEVMLYLADVVENLQKALQFLSILSLVVVFFTAAGFIGSSVDGDDKLPKVFLKVLKPFSVVLLFAVFGFLVLPKQKTIYVIIGIHTAKEIVENPQVKALSGRVFDVLNRKLDELDPQKKDEK